MTLQRKSESASGSDKYIIRQVNIALTYAELPERIRLRIVFQSFEKKGVSGHCWIWTGPLYTGYGRISYRSKTLKAHRAVYEILVGAIPAGLELDHLCCNRACVNPSHLEPVTRLENIKRSHIYGIGNGTRTHCRQGHEFTPSNIYRWHGKRFCLKCQRYRQQAHEKRKAERVA